MTHAPLVLAIETATASVGCAVGGPSGVLAAAQADRGRRHAESLAPQIRFVVDQAGVSLPELSAVAVDVGPGLYTGLRVGITTGMALAHSLGLPMVGACSLDVLAHGARHHGTDIHAVIDARRGEVFHAAYRSDGIRVQAITQPVVADPVELGRSLAARGPVVIVGDGAAAHPEAFAGLGDSVGARPRPIDLLEIAVAAVQAGDTVEPTAIAPCYLREPDAVARWGAA